MTFAPRVPLRKYAIGLSLAISRRIQRQVREATLAVSRADPIVTAWAAPLGGFG